MFRFEFSCQFQTRPTLVFALQFRKMASQTLFLSALHSWVDFLLKSCTKCCSFEDGTDHLWHSKGDVGNWAWRCYLWNFFLKLWDEALVYNWAKLSEDCAASEERSQRVRVESAPIEEPKWSCRRPVSSASVDALSRPGRRTWIFCREDAGSRRNSRDRIER